MKLIELADKDNNKTLSIAKKAAQYSNAYLTPFERRERLREAYNNWLSLYPFEWYLTLTFKYQDISQYRARDELRKLVYKTEKQVFGQYRARDNANQRLSLVAFEERNYSEGLHYHCLIQPPTDLGRLSSSEKLPEIMVKHWKRSNGGFEYDVQRIEDESDIVSLVDYSTKQLSINNDDTVITTWFHKRMDSRSVQ